MNKIFGDEFKSEIAKLKRLDKKILKCKAQSIRVRHICKSDKRLNDVMVTIEDAIGSLLTLSKNVNTLHDLINECEVIYNKMDKDVIELLNKNETDIYNFKEIMRLRIGAEYLSDVYSETLKELGTQLKNKGET
jgi:hypothetical protein|tara:strand:+ start:4795 stop:5196 length:402 start_codon:yes stop_codon:yes gene_type:complete